MNWLTDLLQTKLATSSDSSSSSLLTSSVEVGPQGSIGRAEYEMREDPAAARRGRSV